MAAVEKTEIYHLKKETDMIQIYHGDGKGKTTAAAGLAVRAAGSGLPVLFVQFLKDDTSGEIAMLRKLGIQALHPSVFYGFVSRMNERELAETRDDCVDLLQRVCTWIKSHISPTEAGANEISRELTEAKVPQAVVVLDEILHAVNYDLVSQAALLELLQAYRTEVEFILTGRNPSTELLELADYVTEMKKQKHPFDKGVFARKGIEL